MVDLDSFVGVNALKFNEGWPADPGGRLTWELHYYLLIIYYNYIIDKLRIDT
jgi:hypothetical protein